MLELVRAYPRHRRSIGALREFAAIMTLVRTILGVPELGVALTSTLIESLARDKQEALDRPAVTRRQNAPIAGAMLRTGDVLAVSMHAAEEVAEDLVVTGTHGRRRVGRALLGSTAESVARASHRPVLTIRGREP